MISQGQYTQVFNSRHPCWSENIERWLFYQQMYEGGRIVVEGDSERGLSSQVLKFSREAAYNQRLASTPYINKCDTTINTFRDFLWMKVGEIKRYIDQKDYNEFLDDVDRRHTDIDKFLIQDALPMMLTIGKVLVMMDSPFSLGANLKEQQEKKLRPYLTLINGMNLLNWDYNEDGTFRYIIYTKMIDVKDELSGVITGRERRFVYVDKDHAVEVRPSGTTAQTEQNLQALTSGPNGSQYQEVSNVPNKLGMVNAFELSVEISMLMDIADINKLHLNMVSSLVNHHYYACYPFLSIEEPDPSKTQTPFATTAEGSEETLGPQTGMRIPFGTKHPTWVSPDTATPVSLLNFLDWVDKQIAEKAKKNTRSMIRTAVEQSASSKQWDFLDMNAALSFFSSVLKQAELKVLDFYNYYMNTEYVYDLLAYPSDFTSRAIDEVLEQALKFRVLDIPSPTWTMLLDEQIIQTQNIVQLTLEQSKEIKDELEEAKVRNERMLAMPPMLDEQMEGVADRKARRVIETALGLQDGKKNTPPEQTKQRQEARP